MASPSRYTIAMAEQNWPYCFCGRMRGPSASVEAWNRCMGMLDTHFTQGGQFATVDHMEGPEHIKLEKDNTQQHHYIPLGWVTSLEGGKVHVDRPGDQAMTDWMTTTTIQ